MISFRFVIIPQSQFYLPVLKMGQLRLKKLNNLHSFTLLISRVDCLISKFMFFLLYDLPLARKLCHNVAGEEKNTGDHITSSPVSGPSSPPAFSKQDPLPDQPDVLGQRNAVRGGKLGNLVKTVGIRVVNIINKVSAHLHSFKDET